MESRAIEYLEDNEGEMFSLLRGFVSIQSGTFNKKGVDRMADALLESVGDLPLRARRVENNTLGDIVLLHTAPAENNEAILLVGHMDTVFPADTQFNSYREDENHAFGPGVVDMKGGLVEIVFALKALDYSGVLSRIPLRVVFNSDEEIGSPTSGPIIAEEAKKCRAALVLECGGGNGEVVTGRKGRLGLEIHVLGRSAHAALPQDLKPSAILELARKIIDIEALNGAIPGVTVNIGCVSGGTTPNSVPKEAKATIDIRFPSEQAVKGVRAMLSEIVDRIDSPGTSSSLIEISGRPPMEATPMNKKLFLLAKTSGEQLGLRICEEYRSGTSDANNIAALGTPVLDGLGPLGGDDHSESEFMIKASLIDRAKLLVSMIEVLGAKPISDCGAA